MIFDDITSSVDIETEQMIQGPSLFIVVNNLYNITRISSVRKADVIFVLDKGRIIEKGTRGLMKNKDIP